jgi:drug/metabolite transporter (DMT)-like permease
VSKKNTAFGIVAVLLWGSNMGFSRILLESLGPFMTSSIEMLFSGGVLLLLMLIQRKSITSLLQLPKAYLISCSILFTINHLALNYGIALCENRSQILIITALNYLWPILTIIVSIPILKNRFRKIYFYAGVVITVFSTSYISLQGGSLDPRSIFSDRSWIAYLSTFIAAVDWAFYSAFVTKFLAGREKSETALPLFMLFDGMIALILSLVFREKSNWTIEIWFPLLYTIVFPSLLAYLFWDLGISRGNSNLVRFFSLFTVVLSTISSSVILKIPLRWDVVLCSFLLFLGAYVTQKSILNRGHEKVNSGQTGE